LSQAHEKLQNEVAVRKRAEEAIERERLNLQRIFDTAQAGMLLIDEDGPVTRVNKAIARLVRKEAADILNHRMGDSLCCIHAACAADGCGSTKACPDCPIREAFSRVLRTGETIQGMEAPFRLVIDGRERDFYFSISASPILLNEKKHALLTLMDITSRKEAEAALRESEERFAQIAEQTREMIWEVDAEGLYTYVSRGCKLILGYESEEVVGRMHFFDFHPEAGREAFKQAAFLAFEQQKQFRNLANKALTKDGRELTLLTNGIPIIDAPGNLTGYRGSDCDITERQRAEEALLHSETKFRTLFDLTGDAVILQDENGFIDCNKATLTIFGYSTKEEFCSKNPAGLSPPTQPDGADSEILSNRHIAMAMEKGSHHFEWVHKRADTGETFHADVLLSVMELDGKTMLQGVVRDITKRKQAEATLLESESKYRRLYESISDASARVDMTGRLLEFNPAYRIMLGYSEEELHSLTYRNLTPERWHASEERIVNEQVLTRGYSEVYEKEYVRKDGTVFSVELRTYLIKNQLGEPEGMWAIVRDTTERKQADEALRVSLAEKEILLREVHHRVKNNLAAITALLDLQQLIADDSATTSGLKDLQNRIKSMALAHEMLYQSENLSRIDFDDYLRALISHLRTSAGSQRNIICDVPANGVEVTLDIAVPCGMIVNELVTNALNHAFPESRACSGGTPCEVTVSMNSDGASYILTVADNGVGLPADFDWVRTKSLGLQLVRMLGQHQLGGTIDLDRTEGTKFRLAFKYRGDHGSKNDSNRRG
jgi:PAS domain S-box-containing protein